MRVVVQRVRRASVTVEGRVAGIIGPGLLVLLGVGQADGADPAQARALYLAVVDRLRATGHTVETGEFGAMMDVELVNDGPVTLMLDSERTF